MITYLFKVFILILIQKWIKKNKSLLKRYKKIMKGEINLKSYHFDCYSLKNKKDQWWC